ncbi:MAG TPA: hypothetical protein VJL82_04195 [Rhizomicrobium sp.]|nr:hypothetical protein [Rhizomicrobium sp.]
MQIAAVDASNRAKHKTVTIFRDMGRYQQRHFRCDPQDPDKLRIAAK